MSLGIQGSYLNYGSSSGIVYPLVNVGPNFDTLNYSYKVVSYLLMVNPSLIFFSRAPFHPFITLGLGMAWNRLTSYQETPSSGSSASPSLFTFRNHTTSTFSYAPGLGLEHLFNKYLGMQVSYQYLHAGNAELNTLSNQETNERLKAGTLSAHLLALNFVFA